MKLLIKNDSLKNANAGRGVGHYTRLLIDAIKRYTSIELVATADGADIVHYPFFDLFFLTLPLLKQRPTVVTVHDVIPLLYPQEYPRGVRGRIKQYIQTLSLTGARHVVTDSACSTHDVIQLLKQPKEKITTVYLAPDPEYKPTHPADLKNPYFMYTGDINFNKNLSELLRQFSRIPKDYLLVLVCRTLKRNNPAAAPLWKIVDELGIEKQLRIVTDATTQEMCALYSGALWYVQPSLYEGFGLPVLEAQACNCPVMSTQGGSLKEITEGSAFEFDLGKALEADRATYISLGSANVKRFSWEKTAEQMNRIYLKCAS